MAVTLTKAQRKDALQSIEQYFHEELELEEMGEMQAGFLLDYFFTELAPLAYNQGVRDAQRYFLERTEDLTGSLFEDEFVFWSKRAQDRKGR